MRAEDALLILNCDAEILAASPSASEFLRIPPEELCGKRLMEFIRALGLSNADITALEEEFRKLAAGEGTEVGGNLRVADGAESGFAFQWRLGGLVGAAGACTVSLSLFREEGNPHSTAAENRDAFEQAVEGLFRTSLTGHYLEVNPALALMYGYRSPSELMEKLSNLNTQLYLQPTRRAEFVQMMMAHGFVSDFESEVFRADGTIMWIAEFGRLVSSAEGEPLYFEGSVIDMTGRKLAEASIKASEEKYRHLVEMTSVVPWEADLETGAFTYVGPQAVDFLGYGLESWLEPDFWERIVHEEDRRWVKIVRGEAIENRQRFECEYRLVRQDGEVVWAREIVSVLPGSDGRPCLGGFMLDVSYRRESEASLRESQDFIEQIAEASPTISYLYDPVRRKSTYVNGRVPGILGYTKEALSEMSPLFLVSLAHPDEAAGHLEYFEGWLDEPRTEIREREFRLRNALGGWVWLRSRECIFRKHPRTGSLRILGSIEDITLQRQTMDELAENERIFRRLAETTGAIPFDYDLSTDRFAYVGPQAETAFGHQMRRWYSAGFWQSFVFEPDSEDGVRFIRDSFSQSDQNFQTEFRVCAADGRKIWVRQIVHRATDEDDGRRVRGFLFDVTEAREAEEERERSRAQLRELAARGQQMREEERMSIAREIHDELGQALTLFTIDLAWLQTRVARTVPDEARQVLEERIRAMGEAVQRTLGIVRRILCSLRPPLLDELGLKEAIEWQMQEFSKRVGIRYELDATPIRLLPAASATVAFRILQEILTNAARHAKASRIKVYLKENETEFTMSVEDNGVGMTECKLPRKNAFGILGMRERAWSVGGEVEIVGTPGHGTTVRVRIPVEGAGEAGG